MIAEVTRRQNERRESVRMAHARNTVWCCNVDAEEAVDDCATLLREVERLSRELAEARAALTPFARKDWAGSKDDPTRTAWHVYVNIADVQRAIHALAFRNPTDGDG